MFFVTVYVGAGLIANDRRANALQIYLSKPLTRAEYVVGKLAILMAFLLLVTWVPAHAAADRADRCSPAASRSCEQPVPVSGDHGVLVPRRCTLATVDDAGAVVAVEEQPVRRHHVRRRSSSSRRRIYGVLCGVTRSIALSLDVVPAQPRRSSAT